MRVCKLQNLLRLFFICRDVIYFTHYSAFPVPAAMCTAVGRGQGQVTRFRILYPV